MKKYETLAMTWCTRTGQRISTKRVIGEDTALLEEHVTLSSDEYVAHTLELVEQGVEYGRR